MKKLLACLAVVTAVSWLVACQVFPAGDPGAHYRRGQSLFASGRAEEGIDAFNEAIKLDPDMWEAYVGRGCCYVIDGKFEKALADFDFSEPRLSRNALLLRYRGAALVELNRPSEAAESLTEAIELDPGNAFAHWVLGLSLELEGRLEDACDELSKAVELDDDNADLLVDRAGIQLQLERFDDALVDANRALQLKPNHAAAFVVRSLIHMARLDLEASSADRQAALKLDPALRRTMRSGAGTRRPIVLGPSIPAGAVRSG